MQSNALPLGNQMLSESKFYSDYSRWLEAEQRYETWEESVGRVMDMHREKYADVMTPELQAAIDFAESMYVRKRVLGAQRALQYGGEQIFKHEGRLYNCSSSWCDRPEFFQQAVYLLLCGCGVGFSVQKRHIEQMPSLAERKDESKLFTIRDSIESWADAFGVLVSSFIATPDQAPFPEYAGYRIAFDFSEIRPKGAFISGGFKAPGPEPLRAALIRCENLLEKHVRRGGEVVSITPIVAYDLMMYMADAVVSGGVRRSATICLFDKDDQEMLQAKTGNWFHENPQRGRSNNSVVLLRDELTRREWAEIMKNVKEFGEPGFVFTENLDFVFNPCVEIGMLPVTEDGRSGFQMCNLTEINGGLCDTYKEFLEACTAAAILGTLQAGYASFPYLGAVSDEIVQREALLGCSITGWMNNPDVLFNKNHMRWGAEEIRKVNKRVASIIGINPAARTTCVKPSGNASVLLGTASGIHGEHAPRYFRNVQINQDNGVAQLVERVNPVIVEPSVWSQMGTDSVVAYPITSKPGSIFKHDLLGVKQLEYVKLAQQHWVEHGTNVDLCRDDTLRHNVSNTIQVDDWAQVEQYLFDNRQWFAGVSLMDATGDRSYNQAPFTQVYTPQEILDMYQDAAMFASGLIVDGLYAFTDNLWMACDTVLGRGAKVHPSHSHDLLKRDWVRRALKFAYNYFNGDTIRMIECLKDVYNLHKWDGINRQIIPIDFARELSKQEYTDVGVMTAQACSGDACEVAF